MNRTIDFAEKHLISVYVELLVRIVLRVIDRIVMFGCLEQYKLKKKRKVEDNTTRKKTNSRMEILATKYIILQGWSPNFTSNYHF